MKTAADPRLEAGRVRGGKYGSTARDGLMGSFRVHGPRGAGLVIFSSGVDLEFGWEHVSVSCEHRTPNWYEMCWVKDLFWSEDECVVQYHPPRSAYVNVHPHCLHLWRPVDGVMPMPPSMLVGPKVSV
jgi:hypothetical protein